MIVQMNKFLTALLFLSCTTIACAQRVMRLGDARSIGLTTEHMDSLYKNAFNIQDTADSAFPGRMDEFLERWQATLRAIGTSLHSEGFRHPHDIPVTYRIFFGGDGRIEHFHYAIREALTPELEQHFRQCVEKFIASYNFPMKPDGPFKQCGKMVLQADPE